MFIRSERLFLRPAWPEDTREIRQVLGYDGVAQACTPRHPQFLITLPDHHGAHIVGMICFSPHHGQTELGVWIGRAWRNRGYATEATRAALSLARTLGHRRLIARPVADCPASRLVLARLGFVPRDDARAQFGPAREVHVLDLSAPASDPLDPAMARHAA